MIKRDKDRLKSAAAAVGMKPEEMAVRLARRHGASKRIIVRNDSGGLRVVLPGEKLNLAENEFIMNTPIRMLRVALRETANRNGDIKRSDLDD